MTDDQIRELIAAEVAKYLASVNNVILDTTTDEVLETIMFTKPPEWGRRVIRRGNEIILQITEDTGKTWIDSPNIDYKPIISESNLKSTSNNPYAGLQFIPVNAINTKGTSQPLAISTEAQEIIDSGTLLAKRLCSTEEQTHILSQRTLPIDELLPYNGLKIASLDESNSVEAITFMGGFTTFGLQAGAVWRDDNNYLRIVP